MELSRESEDAIRQCVEILSHRRGVEDSRAFEKVAAVSIYQGEWPRAFSLSDIAALFYPNEPVHENSMRVQMLAALKAGALQSSLRGAPIFLASDLAAWSECPSVPKNSPLRFWLPELMQEAKPLSESTSNAGEIRKRAAFIKEVADFWPSVESDLSDASRRSSGLSEAARVFEKKGFWKVEPALRWAMERGKIVKKKAASFSLQNDESYLSLMLKQLLERD